ncbi:MAG: orotate phosphoribosyltransferase, partial [Gammaproteobacteria bacterium]
LFNTGAKLGKLGEFYAKALLQSGLAIDVLYGPAYKGIPLVSAAAIAYSGLSGGDIPFAFNRKEAKDHGEGGVIVGTPLYGKVLIIDDVITAGTSVRESVDIIGASGAEPVAVLIALDRQERGQDATLSATMEVGRRFGLQVLSIITLDNVVEYLEQNPTESYNLSLIKEYRQLYGI